MISCRSFSGYYLSKIKIDLSGRGSVWLERSVRDAEVGGSSPLAPTIFLPMEKRIHVFFSGRVQGVGFRFTAVQIAQELGVCGWVRNMHDSRVEVVAEAREDALKDFLSRIESRFSRYIQYADVTWLDATQEYSDFGVKF